MTTLCDVIDNCTECPRYGDDCDGDKRLYTHEEAWGMCDPISRADAIESVMAESRKVYTSEYANAERIIYEADAVEALSMLPSAEAVQGEWIHDGQKFKGGLDWCHCSVCGQKTSTSGLSMYRFCPNCGARMKAR